MSEASVAKRINANDGSSEMQLIKNSGRNTRKGDAKLKVSWANFIVDIKEGKSLALNESVWAKVCTDANTWGSEYIPMILRVLPNGTMIACVPFDDLEFIVDGAEDFE